MLHFIGKKEVLIISIYGLLLLSIWFGFITDLLAINQASLLYNCLTILSHTIATFYDATFGVALSLFWNQNVKNYQKLPK